MSLRVGDLAPEWTLLGSHGGEVKEMSLRQLVAEHRAVVVTTYVLDFTGG